MWSIMFQGFSWIFMVYLELQDCSFPLGTVCRAPIRLSYFAVSSDILNCARFSWNLLTWNDQESCTSLVHTGHLNAYRILCSVWGVYFLCVVVSDGWQQSGESRQVHPWCRREYSQDRISLCYRGTNWWTLLEQEAVIRSSSIRHCNGYNLGRADCLEMAGRIFRRAGDPSLSEWDGFAVDHPVHAAEFVRAWSCCEELFFFAISSLRFDSKWRLRSWVWPWQHGSISWRRNQSLGEANSRRKVPGLSLKNHLNRKHRMYIWIWYIWMYGSMESNRFFGTVRIQGHILLWVFGGICFHTRPRGQSNLMTDGFGCAKILQAATTMLKRS